MRRIERFTANTRGRDIAVGDIHGHFLRLQERLTAIGFDPAVDRLFSVGDLVDRGPECPQALEWLAQPWFHAVQGNHEALAVTHVDGGVLDYSQYQAAGGGWFLALSEAEQTRFAVQFRRLPLALEVETEEGLIGLLHADSPVRDWAELREQLADTPPKAIQEFCQWSRKRLYAGDDTPIEGLRALIVGHTPQRDVRVLGNVWHIDTGGWASGRFSLLDLGSLRVISDMPGE
ncbi:metallophosphoesterase [Pseudomonas rubra]|uniref:Metallophosphoesterase n=1 Tax=Pseudomonas rubra TaxID=2942627 RepID=A0ABT5PGB5_9PSED|nr:metallophosphoesterase [Pseudomonas rubra]MDD1017043.1 metallophosphoesterase [Pseudomonas rubra]MDD1037102.1 metallophosphoesterase [Pseudomonas rubra]MDD1153763.1 metallophosphoesterase [Pseudomonas rubra]